MRGAEKPTKASAFPRGRGGGWWGEFHSTCRNKHFHFQANRAVGCSKQHGRECSPPDSRRLKECHAQQHNSGAHPAPRLHQLSSTSSGGRSNKGKRNVKAKPASGDTRRKHGAWMPPRVHMGYDSQPCATSAMVSGSQAARGDLVSTQGPCAEHLPASPRRPSSAAGLPLGQQARPGEVVCSPQAWPQEHWGLVCPRLAPLEIWFRIQGWGRSLLV